MNDKQPIESLEAELATMDLGDLTPEQDIALIREPYQHFAFTVANDAIRIYTKECTFQIQPSTLSVGVDLGLTNIATLSDGSVVSNQKFFAQKEKALGMAERAKKKKLAKSIYKKIRNQRRDYLHKESSKIVKKYGSIYVGDLNIRALFRSRLSKSGTDAGLGLFKWMLEYKAIRLGVRYEVVSEAYSTVTCSGCLCRTGPRGLGALGVREWVCGLCGMSHDRDVNAAQNILLGLSR